MQNTRSQAKINNVAVFGLGRFGGDLARRLAELGSHVLAVDTKPDRVEELDPLVSRAICMDATNDHAVSQLNLEDVDLAIVAIGRNIESSLLVTAELLKHGADSIIVRAIDQNQAEILQAMGVTRIVSLEKEMANRVAENLIQPGLQRITSITADHSLAEVTAPEKFAGKSLQQLDLRNTYGLNVVAIKSRETEQTETGMEQTSVHLNDLPASTDIIGEGDILVVVGSDDNIRTLQEEL
ncbi:MAG: potassium channel family protein [Planctomycetota bacterium]